MSQDHMQIRDYQDWLREWDEARDWDRILPSHVMLHALEELGEISRIVQMIEGYRDLDPPNMDEVRGELALELSDLVVMIFKVANFCQIDMQEALTLGQRKADARFPDPLDGPPLRNAYWERFRRFVADSQLDGPSPPLEPSAAE